MSPDAIRRMIDKGMGRVRSAFRGSLRSLDIDKPVQLTGVDGLTKEVLPGLELFQQFGFTSSPPEGTEVIVMPLGGRTSASVIVATENGAYRLRLTDKGEAALYSQAGDHVWIKTGGVIGIQASTRVEIDAPTVHMTGNLVVDGDITDQATGDGRSMAGMRAIYNEHDHAENDSGGPTNEPNQAM